ncbi:MAG: response regulator [Bacteriovorax sp.]|nr:response regulator [Bacteriovorax sp.]
MEKIILIIEDNIEIQDSIKTALEDEGFKVFTANNGKEGIEALRKIPTPCLILLDLMMPVMNGWEFIEVISNDIMLSTIPVVVVSAFGDKKYTPIKSEYIPKPIDLDSLLSTVHKHCG